MVKAYVLRLPDDLALRIETEAKKVDMMVGEYLREMVRKATLKN